MLIYKPKKVLISEVGPYRLVKPIRCLLYEYEGTFVLSIPKIKLRAEGRTLDEAAKLAKEAVRACLECILNRGDSVSPLIKKRSLVLAEHFGLST